MNFEFDIKTCPLKRINFGVVFYAHLLRGRENTQIEIIVPIL
ncbi:MAG: hypothetical protein ACOYVK_07895 [Bacillota bacterium]